MDGRTEAARKLPEPATRESERAGTNGWRNITPVSGSGRPCPQRVKVGTIDGGVPAVRIFTDASEHREARTGMVYGVVLLITGAALLLFTSGPISLTIALACVLAGAAWYQYLNWRLEGTVTIAAFPVHVRIDWQSGWLRQSTDADRRAVSAVQVLPEPARWFPPAMSSTGALATLAIVEHDKPRPAAFLRASAAHAAAQWLADELNVPLEVIEPERGEFLLDNERVQEQLGPGYQEVPLDGDWPGTPQRIWRAEEDGAVVYALPRRGNEENITLQAIGTVAGASFSSMIPAMLSGEWSAILFAVMVTLGSVIIMVLVHRYRHRLPGHKRPKLEVTSLRIPPNAVHLIRPGNQDSEEYEVLDASTLRLVDAKRALIHLGFGHEHYRNTYDTSAALRFGNEKPPTDLANLHPATAEALAEGIHQQLGVPIHREYS